LVQIKEIKTNDLVQVGRVADRALDLLALNFFLGCHLHVHQIVFFNCPDLYQKLPDSGKRQYKSRQLKQTIWCRWDGLLTGLWIFSLSAFIVGYLTVVFVRRCPTPS